MTKRPDEEAVRRALQSLLDATPSSYGTSPFAHIEEKLRERFPDLTRIELAFALHRAAPLENLPLGFGVDTNGRVDALREAEKRLGIPRSAFHEIVAELMPRFLAVHLTDPDAIEAAVRRRVAATVAVVEPVLAEQRRAQTRKATEARQARKGRWAARAAELRARGGSIAKIALMLSAERGRVTSQRTVSRWLESKKP